MTADVVMDLAPGAFRSMAEAGEVGVVDGNGVERSLHLYFGGAPRDPAGDGHPQAFVGHLQPGDEVTSHFHKIDQFQLLFGGPGSRYQRSEISAGTVVAHYADAFSVYGPIVAGYDGLDLFTLRNVGHSFTGYMPGARADLERRGRRNVHWSFDVAGADPIAPGQVTDELVYDDDGVAVHLLRGGPGAELAFATDQPHGGQYHCVIGGRATGADGAAYPAKSLAWVPADAACPRLRADPTDGVQVVVLQFAATPSA